MQAHLDDAGTYQPGDQPPEGYLQWHEWARVQERGGLGQIRCPRCGLYRYPQEPCRRDGVCPGAQERQGGE